MIKKLQRKFILITMISLSLIIILLLGAINGINFYQMEQKAEETLEVLLKNSGKFPKLSRKEPPHYKPEIGFYMNEETPFETRYFTVRIKYDGTIREIDTGHIAAVSSEDAKEYADEVMRSKKDSGYKGIYKYALIEQDDSYILVFLDCRMEIQTSKVLLLTSISVALCILILMFILVFVFSKRAIAPLIETEKKQKQFITDAGHEIKTPITTISANTDVIELTSGKNEWTTSIKNQTRRLDKLVKNLLMLAKMEEDDINLSFSEIDLSESVFETANSFKAVAQMENKYFQLDVTKDLIILADETSIVQLISILIDNAIKYSDYKGTIRVTLVPSKKGIKLEVFNTATDIDTHNLERLFDRFYRADSSRSRETGGYGIGLSIAASIVEAHKGKISVKSDDGQSICFSVYFKKNI